jgi:hypothetical protein
MTCDGMRWPVYFNKIATCAKAITLRCHTRRRTLTAGSVAAAQQRV